MTVSSIALGYARALFDISFSTGITEQVEKELEAIDNLLQVNKDLEKLILHPGVSVQEKKKLVESVFAFEGSPLIKKFLFVLIDKRREKLLTSLLSAYKTIVREVKGIVLAEVQSTIELSDDNIGKLKASLEKLIGKEVEIATSINPKILGGLVIRYGDKLIDGSVRYRLSKLKKKLMQTVPA